MRIQVVGSARACPFDVFSAGASHCLSLEVKHTSLTIGDAKRLWASVANLGRYRNSA